MDSQVLSTPKAAELLGVSRQHMAMLGDRGEVPCWRVGSHRRFRAEDVLAYRSGRPGPRSAPNTMNLSDRRSLVFGILVASKLEVDPETVLSKGRANLRRLKKVHADGSADALLSRWEELLAGSVERLVAVLLSTREESIDLRHASPFAGVLTEDERRWVSQATRAAA